MGGIARFKTVCNEYQEDARFKDQPELLTFFSGDAFNPSLESSVTKGKSSLWFTRLEHIFTEDRKSHGTGVKHHWN